MSPEKAVTEALINAQEGVDASAAGLVPLVYEELREFARKAMAGERSGHTLDPTALVNEALLALVDTSRVGLQGRTRFRAVAARCMRNILVDHARRRAADRRGGGRLPVQIDPAELSEKGSVLDVLEIDDVLAQLSEVSPRGARIVELRFFGGLTDQETAQALGVGERTVRREWTTARAWLRARLAPDES